MLVKIIKCSNENFWYKNLIGSIFKVKYDDFRSSYKTVDIFDDNRCYGYIEFEDCKIVKDENIMVKKYGIEYRKSATTIYVGTLSRDTDYKDYFLLFNTEPEMLRKLAEIKNESRIKDLNVFTISIDKTQNKEPYKI